MLFKKGYWKPEEILDKHIIYMCINIYLYIYIYIYLYLYFKYVYTIYMYVYVYLHIHIYIYYNLGNCSVFYDIYIYIYYIYIYVFIYAIKALFIREEWNHFIVLSGKLMHFNFCIIFLWSKVWKALWRWIKIMPVCFLFPSPFKIMYLVFVLKSNR